MQKFLFFCRKAVFALPAVIALCVFGRWPALAIGRLKPVAALQWLQNPGRYIPQETEYNPFRDFSFDAYTTAGAQKSESNEETNTYYNVIKETFTSTESDIVLKKENCYVKNMTKLPEAQVKEIMLAPVVFSVEKNSDKPQILIMHTHATESYLPPAGTAYDSGYAFRSTDTEKNMVAVGRQMAETLNSLGYNTLQDATLHDYPSYNGSYDKSKVTVESYLEKYPSIKIVLDIHRDAVERNGAIIAPTVTVNGAEYAQIMIISGRDNGHMNMPNYRENLKFASMVQNQLASDWPGLVRPVLFDYRNYNQQLTCGSILVEVGTHGSTLQQALRSARAFAQSLATALDNM